jgi:hypothetical protein
VEDTRRRRTYLLVCYDNVVFVKKGRNVLDEYGRGFLDVHIVALRVPESKYMCQCYGNGRFP